MIGFEAVPEQRIGNRAGGDWARDRIGAHRKLLGVDGDAVVDRRIGGEDRRLGADDMPGAGLDLDSLDIFAVGDIGGVAVDAPAGAAHRAGEAGEIAHRVDAALTREAQRAAGVAARDRRAVGPFGGDAERAAHVVLGLDIGDFLGARREKIAVDAGEIGVGDVGLADRFDPVDGADLAFVIAARRVFAVDGGEFGIIIVERRGEVRGGARGHPAADRAAVDQQDLLPQPRQFIGGRQARDAGSDDHHIGRRIAGERPIIVDCHVHPARPASFVACVH